MMKFFPLFVNYAKKSKELDLEVDRSSLEAVPHCHPAFHPGEAIKRDLREFLESAGIPVTASWLQPIQTPHNPQGRLIFAMKTGNSKLTSSSISQCSDEELHQQDSNGLSALHYAAMCASWANFDKIAKRFPDHLINQQDPFGRSVLHFLGYFAATCDKAKAFLARPAIQFRQDNCGHFPAEGAFEGGLHLPRKDTANIFAEKRKERDESAVARADRQTKPKRSSSEVTERNSNKKQRVEAAAGSSNEAGAVNRQGACRGNVASQKVSLHLASEMESRSHEYSSIANAFFYRSMKASVLRKLRSSKPARLPPLVVQKRPANVSTRHPFALLQRRRFRRTARKETRGQVRQ